MIRSWTGSTFKTSRTCKKIERQVILAKPIRQVRQIIRQSEQMRLVIQRSIKQEGQVRLVQQVR